ncbi:MAG: Gfo/Idh/MocA family oxidoreductase [Merismopedia sp. SIO2A8]|nr:Gfo/Idh/MocA family oxidoreductase [Symploca sp. SIO2B6]NET50874.1 Gfo/Idh/MocA family oxidoreductase [Merismopedia sp. SIO2A8]
MMVRTGLVGTGYAAKKRAEAVLADGRAELVAIAGQSPERTHLLAQTYHAQAETDWQTLVSRVDLDLIIVATRNNLHGLITRKALMTGKHVVVEYPLSLEVSEARDLVQLANAQGKLLHVEHIELLSGIHQTIKEAVADIGIPCYGRYASFKGEQPAPQKWSYDAQQFGFPLIGALSRVQRLLDLFGPVETVRCSNQYWAENGQPIPLSQATAGYSAVLCSAYLTFETGLVMDLVYGKGACLWSRERVFDVHGTQGRLVVEPHGGSVISEEGQRTLTVGSRRGLFAKDMAMVLDTLEQGTPLYIAPETSITALVVAEAARRSVQSQQVINVQAI